MKMKYLLNLIIVLSVFSTVAQAPDLFNYQGVALNPDGTPIAEASIGVELSVSGTLDGPAIYTETHVAKTNSQGVFSLQIGSGVPTLGTFVGIDWPAGTYYLQVGLDPEGGSDYKPMGASQLVSVPYALHATTAEYVNDADADPANEIELPEQVGGDAGLFLQADGAGGVAYVEATAVNVDDADADASNELLTSGTLNGTDLELVDAGGTTTVDLSSLVDDADADATNELQELVLDGSMLSISSGALQIDISNGANTDNQNIAFDGTNLSITGGNSIDISSLGDDADADATNELLTAAGLNGNNLELTDAGGMTSVDISSVNTDNQTAAEVTFDNATSGLAATDVKAALDELDAALDAGVLTDDQNASQVNFDNTTSGFAATNVQDALDEVDAALDAGSLTDDQIAAEVAYDNAASGLTATDVKAALDELNQVDEYTFRLSSNNVYVGGNSGITTPSTAFRNTGLGQNSLQFQTGGVDNLALGYNALNQLTDANSNVAVGAWSLQNLTDNSTGNIGVGVEALEGITSGSIGNVALGFHSAENLVNGNYNIAIGDRAFGDSGSGIGSNGNISIGNLSMAGITSGDFNIVIGQSAGNNIAAENSNVLIGDLANTVGPISNAVAIGRYATVAQDNAIVLGDVTDGNVRVGIGTNTPTEKLDVVGNVAVSGTITGTVAYDNTTSGLIADNVQAAIDEVEAAVYPGIRTYLVEDNTQAALQGDVWTDYLALSSNIQVDRDGSSVKIDLSLAPMEMAQITRIGFRIRLNNSDFTTPSICVNDNLEGSVNTESSHFSFIFTNISAGNYDVVLQWIGDDAANTFTLSSWLGNYDSAFGYSRMITTVMP